MKKKGRDERRGTASRIKKKEKKKKRIKVKGVEGLKK